MKRYLAFFGDNFYPDGGMGDFLSDHSEATEAIKAISNADRLRGGIQGSLMTSWGHVYDTVNKEIVYKQ